MSITERLFGKGSNGKVPRAPQGDYLDLGEFVQESASGEDAASTYIRVAEIHRLDDFHEFATYVYDGNILILDFRPVAEDEITLKRLTNELRKLAQDVHGDIAGLGEHQIIITPTGVKVDRRKIRVQHA